jgi:hypothetical protein
MQFDRAIVEELEKNIISVENRPNVALCEWTETLASRSEAFLCYDEPRYRLNSVLCSF